MDRILGIGWLGIGQIGVELPVGVPTERNEKIRDSFQLGKVARKEGKDCSSMAQRWAGD